MQYGLLSGDTGAVRSYVPTVSTNGSSDGAADRRSNTIPDGADHRSANAQPIGRPDSLADADADDTADGPSHEHTISNGRSDHESDGGAVLQAQR